MKKIALLIFAVVAVYAFIQDWQANKAVENSVEYATAEGTPERTAEEIIRDVWGVANNWSHCVEKMPTGRVVSIRIIPQADKTYALDMRIRIDEANHESEVIFQYLRALIKLMPKLLLAEKLDGINEFRFFGSLPMSHGGTITEDSVTKLCIKRELAQKIAWNEADEYNLHKYLTKINDGKNCTYWIHGAILSEAKYLK